MMRGPVRNKRPAMRLHTLTSTLLTMALLSAATAFAADKPKKEGSFGTGKPSGAILSRDQLRACLAQQARVAQQDDELPKEKAQLAGAHSELVRNGEALKQRLETLDRSDAPAVAAYNDEAQARDKRIDELQARVSAFNARVEAFQVEREAFVKACGNRSFFEEDEIAIKKGK